MAPIMRKFRIDIGIQLPEKYKENVDVSSECPSLGSYRRAFVASLSVPSFLIENKPP
jgi:hypothetical protein